MSTKAINVMAAAAVLCDRAAPYFSQARASMRMVEAPELPFAMAVDDKWRCYYNPALLANKTPNEIAFIMCHEVRHLLFDHAGRRAAGGRDQKRWNYAADAELNGAQWTGLVRPAGAVVAEEYYKMPSGLLAEQYYTAEQAAKPQDKPGDPGEGKGNGKGDGNPAEGQGEGGPGPGSSADGFPRPWELAPDAPQAAGMTPLEAQAVRSATAESVRAHSGRGSLPGGLEVWAGSVIKPVVPVRSLIHSAICRGANSTGLGVRSYSRIKRRGPVCTPRHKAQVPVVCLVVDTSGSMGRGNGSDLQKAVSLVVGIARTIGTVNVVWTDTEPHLKRNVTSPSGIKCKGGGGTDMREGVAFADALRGRDQADVLVLVTDGYTPWPERQTRAELVTVITTSAPGPRHGRVIRAK